MSVKTVLAKKDASIDDIKRQALQEYISRKAEPSKRTDAVKPRSMTAEGGPQVAAVISKKEEKVASPEASAISNNKNTSIRILAQQKVLKKINEKAERSNKKKEIRSTLRLASSNDTAETDFRISLSSHSALDDESVQSVGLSTTSSLNTTELQDDVFFDAAMHEVAMVCSSMSRDDALQSLLSKELLSLEAQNERAAILAIPALRDFYLGFIRQLHCMIASCEVLSTDMVISGSSSSKNGSYAVRYIGKRVLQPDTIIEEALRTRPDLIVANFVRWVKKKLAAVPLADVVGGIVQLIVALNDEKEQYKAIRRVADFATAVSFSTSGSSSNEICLRNTVEHISRMVIRALCFLPQRDFVQERSEFGKIKQSMLHLLGDISTNTRAKEQAHKAASSVLAHIMMPQSKNNGMLNFSKMLVGGGSSDAFPDVVVAMTLDVSGEEIQSLPRVPSRPPAQFTGSRIEA